MNAPGDAITFSLVIEKSLLILSASLQVYGNLIYPKNYPGQWCLPNLPFSTFSSFLVSG